MALKIVEGDIWEYLETKNYSVIAQGCNCFSVQGAGIAIDFVEKFRTDLFDMEVEETFNLLRLGNIDWEYKKIPNDSEFEVAVVNCYTQFGVGKSGNHIPQWLPASEGALRMCLEKIRYIFGTEESYLFPLIGGGLGGLDKFTVIKHMKEVFEDCDATLVLYEK